MRYQRTCEKRLKKQELTCERDRTAQKMISLGQQPTTRRKPCIKY